MVNEFYSQGQSRIVYDTIPHGAWFPRPFDAAHFIKWAQRCAPYYINNWDAVTSKCKINLIRTSDSAVIGNALSFPTLTDLGDYINAHVPENPEFPTHFLYAFKIEIYDDVDDNIQAINRMYGINRLYNGLVGKKKTRTATTCENIRPSWVAGKYMLWDMWKTQNPWLNFLDSEEFYLQDGHKACWTSARYNRRNGIPPMTQKNINTRTITLTTVGSNGRYTGCNNWEGCNQADAVIYELQNPLIYYWNEFGNGGSIPLSTIYDPKKSSGERKSLRAAMASANSSAVLFYRVKGPGEYPGTDDVDWAIYIKPVGIDMLGINYIDTTRYDIESVAVDTDKTIRFKNCNSSITERDSQLDRCSLLKSAWIFGNEHQSYKQNTSSHNPSTVAFRLRDKTTNKVSRLSRSRVVAQKDHLYVPLRWLVMPEERIRQ